MLDKIDVIIPTYNRWDELKKTLSKLKELGFKENQIFVYDDSSNNTTSSKIKKDFPNIQNTKPSKNSNGVIAARNFLWTQCTRPYVLSLDDDSAPIATSDITEAINILEKDPRYGIFAFNIYEAPYPPTEIPANEDIRHLRLFTACGCLFRQELMQTIKYYAWEKLFFHGEEFDCAIRAFKNGYSVVTKDNLLLHHRVNWNQRNLKKWGKYGKIWRSANGFSANLIIALKYYPLGYDLIFILRYIWLRLIYYAILRGHILGFLGGIIRFLYFIPAVIKESDKLPAKDFKKWISLKTK